MLLKYVKNDFYSKTMAFSGHLCPISKSKSHRNGMKSMDTIFLGNGKQYLKIFDDFS